MRCLLLFLLAFQAHARLSNEELERRLNLLAEEMAQIKAHQTYSSKNESAYGLSQSASKVYHIPQGLSIGGYGELYYLNAEDTDQAGNAVDNDAKAEALRNIIYIGYKFDDKWLVNMELEIEHVSQVFTEFLYADYLQSDELNFRFGLMLHPIGFVNELHEPALYPSVLRPDIETYIIPTTWRSLGMGAFGSLGKLDYKVYLMNGMNAEGFSAGSLRGGRKRGGHYPDGSDPSDSATKEDNQRASTVSAAIRADYNITDSLMVGASTFVGQASGDEVNLDQMLSEVHLQLDSYKHRFRILYADNFFANVDRWNAEATNTDLARRQRGYYVEYLYRIGIGKSGTITPFVRYENYNMQAELDAGFTPDASLVRETTTIGLAYLPLDRLIFKLDYAKVENEAHSGVDKIAFGMGYNF